VRSGMLAREIVPHRFMQQVRVYLHAKHIVGQVATGIVVSLQGRLGLANENVSARRAGNRTANEQQVFF
jgi:hypothetical protein